jgi:predicted acyltransferase
VSLDAYRGFIMLVMASGGFALTRVATHHEDSAFWQALAYQFDHVKWTGCAFWDLIQPSFMFMVGVAIPFSFASRRARGQSLLRITGHVMYRSLILIVLGVFLTSNGSPQTDFAFVNVLTQIGLGYAFVYLLLGRGPSVQLLAALAILAGYWYLFFQHPVPGPDFSYAGVPVPDQDGWTTGLFAHWNKHTNWAAFVDRQFLALFPYSDSYPFNRGGYQTLNFIPSLATMIFGLMAGELLRGPRSSPGKFRLLFAAGALCLIVGLVLNYTVCPSVKRIWTPSWAIFSTGWTLWMLAAFYWLIDLHGWRRWAFPFVVVGMNSIAMYCMSQLIKGWVGKTLVTHLGHWWEVLLTKVPSETAATLRTQFGSNGFEGIYGPLVLSVAVLFVLWLVCLWLYRRGIFLRI